MKLVCDNASDALHLTLAGITVLRAAISGTTVLRTVISGATACPSPASRAGCHKDAIPGCSPHRPNARTNAGPEAADLIITGIPGTIGSKTVTYDFERLMDGAALLKCSEFGERIVKHMAEFSSAWK